MADTCPLCKADLTGEPIPEDEHICPDEELYFASMEKAIHDALHEAGERARERALEEAAVLFRVTSEDDYALLRPQEVMDRIRTLKGRR